MERSDFLSGEKSLPPLIDNLLPLFLKSILFPLDIPPCFLYRLLQ